MKKRGLIKGYYFLTDENLSLNGSISDVKSAVKAGVSIFQYRNKTKNSKELYNEALLLKRAAQDRIFLINDRLDIALLTDADGVHIGQDDVPLDACRKVLGYDKIIGVTAHNLEEALIAEKNGADYVAVSPIFSTATKKDAGNPCGLETLKEVKSRLSIPCVAIGGINYENAPQVIEAGADSIVAISAVITKDNVTEEIRKFQDLF